MNYYFQRDTNNQFDDREQSFLFILIKFCKAFSFFIIISTLNAMLIGYVNAHHNNLLIFGIIKNLIALFGFTYLGIIVSVILTGFVPQNKIFHSIVFDKKKYLIYFIAINIFALFAYGAPLSLLSFIPSKYPFNQKNNPFFCSLNDCDHIDIQFLIQIYIFPVVSIPIFFYVTVLFYEMYKLCQKCKICKRSNIKSDELAMSLLGHSSSEEMDLNMNYNTPSVLWIFLYPTCLGISILIIIVTFNLKVEFIHKYYVLFTFILSVLLTTFKFILKRIARKCDLISMYSSKFNYFYSLEYLSQWLMTMIYWFLIRVLLYIESPSINKFIASMLIHFIQEIMSTSGRFTIIYYETVQSIYNKCKKYQNSSSKLYKCIYFVVYGLSCNCTLNEWHDRLSMDLITRIYASICSGVFALAYCLSVGEKDILFFYNSNGNYKLILIYIISSTIIELLYYCIVFIFNLKYYKYNILLIYTKRHICDTNKTYYWMYQICIICIVFAVSSI